MKEILLLKRYLSCELQLRADQIICKHASCSSTGKYVRRNNYIGNNFSPAQDDPHPLWLLLSKGLVATVVTTSVRVRVRHRGTKYGFFLRFALVRDTGVVLESSSYVRRMLAPTSDYVIRLRRTTTKCLGILRPITYVQFYREQRAPSTQRHRALYYSPCSGVY